MDKMKNVCWAMALMVVFSGGWVMAEGSDPIPGMISYWKLDEGAGEVAHDAFGNNDGTIHGAEWTTGQIGDALTFNGVDNYVDLDTDSSLKPEFPITFSAWINRFSTGTMDAIVHLGRGQTDWYFGSWFNVASFNKLEVQYGDGTGKSSTDRRSKSGTTNLNIDTWYHVAAVVRGAHDMDLYVNGQDDGGSYSGSGGSMKYAGANGSSFVGGGFFKNAAFDGVIDEVSVWNRALSPEEILQNYLDGLEGFGYELDQRQVAINKVEWAIAAKTEALELVNLAIEKERAAFAALDELKASGDLGELSVMDVFKARLEILWAMGRQIHAKFNLRRSIRKLETALDRLTLEPGPEGEGPVHPERPVRPRRPNWPR